MDISLIISPILGIAGLLYALYQGSERRKLSNYIRSQSWYLYEKANNLTGTIQNAEAKYREKHNEQLDVETIGLLSTVNSLGQNMFNETIRQIQLSEPKFDFKHIELWFKQGKISITAHKSLFALLVVGDDTPSSNERLNENE